MTVDMCGNITNNMGILMTRTCHSVVVAGFQKGFSVHVMMKIPIV